MANRATKFVSAIFVGAMVGFPVSTLAEDAMGTADASTSDASSAAECVTTPNRESAQGQHWFYRVEQGTNRRCWYLRDQAERASQSASPRATSSQSSSPQSISPQWVPATAPAAVKASSRNAQAPHSLSNARAELAGRPTSVDSSGPAVPKAPVFITTGSAGMDRGGSVEAEATEGAAAAPNSSDSPDATSVTAPSADTPTMTTDGAGSDAGLNPNGTLPPTIAQDPAKASASLQVLFLVILGALAFAGLTASLIHRLARVWRRRHAHLRRRSIWRAADSARGSRAGVKADSLGRSPGRRVAGALLDDGAGQIKKLLAQLAKQARSTTAMDRVPAKSRAAAATRGRKSSVRRAVRASASRP
jgi:hypothetical protein